MRPARSPAGTPEPHPPGCELTRCPVCVEDDARVIAGDAEMKCEVERLWGFHERRLRPPVPIEHLADRVTFSQYPPVRLAQCRHCTHVYRNPWESRAALRAAYNGPLPNEACLQALFDTQRATARLQLERLRAITQRKGRGLEVGTYAGTFLSAAREAGWDFEGVDISRRAVEFASRRGLRVTHGEIEDVSTMQPFDVVVIWNTFEQLYDVRAAAIVARRLLRPGGTLALRVPNGGFYVAWRALLDGPLAWMAMLVLGHNNLLSFPYRQGFTERSLARLLEETQFEIVKVFGDMLVPVADGWTTPYGAMEERVVKGLQRTFQRHWRAPWVEVYARAR